MNLKGNTCGCVSGSALPQMQPWSDSLSIFSAQLQNEEEEHYDSHGRNQNLMSIANLFSSWRKNEDKYEVRYLVPYSSNSNVKLLNMPRNQSAIVPPCEQ